MASASEPATGLSMNTRLAGGQHRLDLLQVRPAVDALQQHDVDLLEQLVDRIDDLDSLCRGVRSVYPLTRSLLDGMSGLPPGIPGDDPHAGQSRPSPSGR